MAQHAVSGETSGRGANPVRVDAIELQVTPRASGGGGAMGTPRRVGDSEGPMQALGFGYGKLRELRQLMTPAEQQAAASVMRAQAPGKLQCIHDVFLYVLRNAFCGDPRVRFNQRPFLLLATV